MVISVFAMSFGWVGVDAAGLIIRIIETKKTTRQDRQDATVLIVLPSGSGNRIPHFSITNQYHSGIVAMVNDSPEANK